MAYLVLGSKITIGSANSAPLTPFHSAFQFSGVHEVHIKKSIHSPIETATVTLPSLATYIPKNGSSPIVVTLGNNVFDGDPITIDLGYNGDLKTEFVGFIKRRNLSMPLVLECEGYSYQLRNKVAVSADFTKKKTSAKQLLQMACGIIDGEGNKLQKPLTDVTVQCDVDFPLIGMSLTKADGVRICDYIKEASDHTLTIFFKSPTVLWCGLVYTAYSKQSTANTFSLPTVKYRIGYNTPKDNELKEKILSEPVQVIMKGKLATAIQIFTKSKRDGATRKVQTLVNRVPDESTVKKFAQEKEYYMNYTGFEGRLTGFLQPYALPGYDGYVVHPQYPDLKGTYVIESTDVRFGVRGARRICQLGPRVGFDE